jgi:hypothetical protein
VKEKETRLETEKDKHKVLKKEITVLRDEWRDLKQESVANLAEVNFMENNYEN